MSERRFRSLSPEATEDLAAALGVHLPAGSVLALSGDLGAGKTCFVRGLARGLGITETVSSPTYILMQAYEGAGLPLYHYDAWLEGREKALFSDGGDEWLYGEGVSAIEWAGRIAEHLPEPRLEVELSHLGPEERGLVLRVVGPEGEAKKALAEALAAWSPPPGVVGAPSH